MLTDAAGGSGKRIIEKNRLKSILEAAFLEQLKEARNVHTERTAILARGYGEFLAHPGPAPFCEDMVLVFIPEMSQCRQDRIRCRLAKTAQGARANHPCKLIERLELLRRSVPIGDRIQYSQGLVEPHPARHTLSARFRMREFNEVSRDIDHAIVFIHHDHSA